MAHVQNERLSTLTQSNEQRLEAVRATLEQRLELLRSDNAQKLEQMRATVDEKLHATLEQRLGESFKLVSDRLEQVHKGLGEMQTLAAGVGDLKRVLTNVKTRGTWGEVQLGESARADADAGAVRQERRHRPGQSMSASSSRFACPGAMTTASRAGCRSTPSFRSTDCQRLQDAQERADLAARRAVRARRWRIAFARQARDIRDKYIAPPHTTDFALLFCRSRACMRKCLRRPGLGELMQRDYRVTLAGPTTLGRDPEQPADGLSHAGHRAALERSVEGAWRGQDRVREVRRDPRQDQEDNSRRRATRIDERAEIRARSIARKLREVEALPEAEATRLLRERDRDLVYDADAEPDADARRSIVEPPRVAMTRELTGITARRLNDARHDQKMAAAAGARARGDSGGAVARGAGGAAIPGDLHR